MYIYIYTSSMRHEFKWKEKRYKKKKERIEVAFCNLDRTAFQISARILLVNPIRIELRPFVTPHPSKLLSDRALITSFFLSPPSSLSLLDHREINSIVLFVAGARSRIELTHRLFSPPRNWCILLSMHHRDSRGPGGSDA